MKIATAIICIIGSTLLLGCSMIPKPEGQPIVQLQTREFETTDTRLVVNLITNVLENQGFTIINPGNDLGIICAEKRRDIEDQTEAFTLTAFEGPTARWPTQQVAEAVATVREYNDKLEVHINFRSKTIDNYGFPDDEKTITDPRLYRVFFDNVSKGILFKNL